MKKFVVCFLLNKTYKKSLLILKKKKIYTGLYNGLGGKVEEGETPKQAVIREIFEESLGVIKLKNPKYLASITFPESEEVPMNNGVTLDVFYDIVSDKIKLKEGEESGGKIEWKPIEFVMDMKNPQLGGDGDIPYYHALIIKNEQILKGTAGERNDKGLWFKETKKESK